MRVVEYTDLPLASGVLTGLDGFAELAGGLGGDPAIGGFRIMRPSPRQRPRFSVRALRRATSARLRASSSLSVLFLGGLALAVLAGSASCPCDPLHAASPLSAGGDARALSRFAYTRASEMGFARAPTAHRKATPLTKLATLVDPYQSTYTKAPSPISTGAIPTASTSRKPLVGLAHLGALPTKIDTITAAQPEPIRIAAVDSAEIAPAPILPVIEVASPEAPKVTDTEATGRTHAAHRHSVSKRRRRHHAHRARKARSSDPAVIAAHKHARAPRWAQQMFENPWQSKAFSYIR
jgi:hypothetical protein